MSAFADSSALVKLYVPEAGHQIVREQQDVVVSQLARVEVPAALWRKTRLGELSSSDAGLLSGAFEADYFGTPDTSPRFAVVAVGGGLLEDAARLTAVHGLRGYDAVQLASARAAAGADPDCRTFAVFDVQLRRAAVREGFALLPA